MTEQQMQGQTVMEPVPAITAAAVESSAMPDADSAGGVLSLYDPLGVPGQSELTLEVLRLLLARTTMDEVAQYLVLDGLAALAPTQLATYEVGPDSLLRLVGAFGAGDGRGDLHEHSVLDHTHIGQGLRRGLPQVNFPLPGGQGRQLAFGGPLADEPQGLWPLLTPTRLCGVVQIRFEGDPDPEDLMLRVSALAPPLALVLDRGWLAGSPLIAHAPTVAPEDAAPPAVTRESIEQLSSRQHRVLEYMAEGMTNAQIARILRFSESTVRQETMAIYRALHVKGRVEAVECARRLGALPEPTP